MLKIYLLLLIISIGFLTSGKAQDIQWSKTQNWKLYDIHSLKGAQYRMDTLKKIRSTDLNLDLMLTFLNSVTPWPPEKSSMWMGVYVATCETADRKLRKILISTYGGFFYDQTTRRYYQISPDLTIPWLQFVNDASKRIRGDK